MNIFLTSPKRLFQAAHVCSALCTVLVYLDTHRLCLAGAVSLGFLTLISLVSWAVCAIAEHLADSDDGMLDHRKVSMPEPRLERWQASHSTGAFTPPHVLSMGAALAGVLLFIPTVVFIIETVMGMQEPKW